MAGETTTARVTKAVVNAVRRDLPEVMVTGGPIRPMLAFGQLAPRSLERLARRSGVDELFRQLAISRDREG